MIKRAATVVKKITAWSFSRFKDYAKCPFFAKCKHVDKLKEPENQHTARGNLAHKQAEKYVGGSIGKLPADLKNFARELLHLRKMSARVEQEWAFDAEWNSCDWFDMQRAFLRIKVDAHYLLTNGKKSRQETTVVIVDYKTGQQRDEEHAEQRELYALGALLRYPDAVRVIAQHWYIDSGAITESVFVVNDELLPFLQVRWLAKVKPMLSDRRFAPRPGNYCRWCHFRKENGGPCQF